MKCLRDPDVGEGLPGEVEMSLDVLADDGLLVVAGHVVPLDTVPVEVVQHGHARFSLSCKENIFTNFKKKCVISFLIYFFIIFQEKDV